MRNALDFARVRIGLWALLATPLMTSACDDGSEAETGDDHHDHDEHCDSEGGGHHHGHGEGNEHTEIISQLRLSFAPTAGGDPVVALFNDPDGKGGMSGVADKITLTQGQEYTLSVSVSNELEMPPEDITPEIRSEAEDHYVFIYGEGVRGPASNSGSALVTHSYADRESEYVCDAGEEDLPVGLKNTIVAENAGTSNLRVMLRHLPELNGQVQKTSELPELMAQSADLPGLVDVDVKFELVVVAAD